MNFNGFKNFLRYSEGKIQICVSSVQAYIVENIRP
jgi:hypothetical protein